MNNVSYKQVSNYIANELGINREFVTEVIERRVNQFLEQELAKKLTSSYFENLVLNATAAAIKHGIATGSHYRPRTEPFEVFLKESAKGLLKEFIEEKVKIETK